MSSEDKDLRLPSAFHRMWAAAGITSLGDGVYLAALPLLASSLTRDPIVISLVTAAEMLPWLFFGLIGGALVDRWDRKRTMWLSDAGRAGLLAFAVVAAVSDLMSIALLISLAFLLGIGQILFDTAAQSYLPQLLDREEALLVRANGRLRGTQIAADGVLGPPMGSALFTLGHSVPFIADAISFMVSAAIVRTLPTAPAKPRRQTTSLWTDIREGMSYLLRNRLLLSLALRPAVGNMAFAAGGAVFILFAQDELHLDAFGYGILLTAQAIGGLGGAAVAGRLATKLGTGTALAVTAGVEAAAQLSLALANGPLWAGISLATTGAGMTATMVLGPSVRQTIVPDHLIGRVSAASRLIAVIGGPLGAILGGVLATLTGLRSPFIFGAILLAAMTLMTAKLTSNSRIEAALAEAKRSPEPEFDPEAR